MGKYDQEWLMTRAEVSDRFGISVRYLELSAGRGEGPRFVRFGRSVRYRERDLLSWIEQCTVDPSVEAGS